MTETEKKNNISKLEYYNGQLEIEIDRHLEEIAQGYTPEVEKEEILNIINNIDFYLSNLIDERNEETSRARQLKRRYFSIQAIETRLERYRKIQEIAIGITD